MSSTIYRLSSTTLPRTGVIAVPCHRAQSFNGKTALLQREGVTIPFDFSTLTEQDFKLATTERVEGWTIQGLVAVDSDWLVEAMVATAMGPVVKPLGAEVDEVWYYMSPINTTPTVLAGNYVVVGLYR